MSSKLEKLQLQRKMKSHCPCLKWKTLSPYSEMPYYPGRNSTLQTWNTIQYLSSAIRISIFFILEEPRGEQVELINFRHSEISSSTHLPSNFPHIQCDLAIKARFIPTLTICSREAETSCALYFFLCPFPFLWSHFLFFSYCVCQKYSWTS